LKTIKNIKHILLLSAALLTLLFTASPLQAQYSSVNKKALKWYRQAEEAYRSNNNQKALQLLSRAAKKDPLFVEVWLLKADVLTTTGKNDKAIKAYQHALAIDSTFFPPAWFYMGDLLMSSGNYAQASEAFQTFMKMKNVSPALRKKAKRQLLWAETAEKLTDNPVKVTITRLDSSINTTDDEFVNYVSTDNKELIFTRKTRVLNPENSEAAYREQFFKSEKQDSVWKKTKRMKLPWAVNQNVGAMSLTADGKALYFTGCRWPDGIGRCDLYTSHLYNHIWQEPVNLGSTVNSTEWESQPFVSANGKYLLFSSTRPGGYGGSDIWMSVKLKNNRWSPPVNLGDSINTAGNEMAPFLYADNQTLVFSSDGHPGMGQQDLFISRKNRAGIWSKAENLGYPINTKQSEINLIYSLDGKHIWISSNRESNNYNIFEIPVYPNIKPEKVLFFRGKVVDAKTEKPLPAQVILTDVITGRKISSRYSTSDDGTFLMVMEPRQTYAFNIMAKGYLMLSDKFTPEKELPDSISITKTFRLMPINRGSSFTLNNIYFETDSPELNSRSFAELSKLVDFLKLNPALKLEIRGHTDNSGGTDYNLTLSRQRAKAVFTYLTAHGVSKNRLSFKGFGASQPVAGNNTNEGKAKNRRVELVVK